ncbi:hypothetical protein D9613_010109 [Agrocybe pediades]|uniref:Uncharacterized protein n=1 Tax=Agrocybe pediades TaxID=84607 RepID=A0A8H4VQI2_9AGAR|nr:hypothetical protein D9613_010109 [Agrocybe pediades]
MKYSLSHVLHAKFFKRPCDGGKPVEEPTGPQLPPEIWYRIIGYAIRLTGARNVDLDDPFLPETMQEERPEIEEDLFKDRKALSQVCSSWHAEVQRISAEYFVIYTQKQLKAAVKLLEKSKRQATNKDETALGERTLRVDFRITGKYKVPYVVRLLQCTPNLAIYYNKIGQAHSLGDSTPIEVLKALAEYCRSSLRRVEWAGSGGEFPQCKDLLELCRSLPELVTLRLTALHSWPSTPYGWDSQRFVLPKLKTLSLGSIPPFPNHPSDYPLTWDPLLRLLTNANCQLPSLRRFECDIFPLRTPSFFDRYGPQLQHFRVPSESVNKSLPDVLNLCPNLQTLVIVQGCDVKWEMPPAHQNIRRICFLPVVDSYTSAPERIYAIAVIKPLHDALKVIEAAKLPRLAEVRVHNIGAFNDLTNHDGLIADWYFPVEEIPVEPGSPEAIFNAMKEKHPLVYTPNSAIQRKQTLP